MENKRKVPSERETCDVDEKRTEAIEAFYLLPSRLLKTPDLDLHIYNLNIFHSPAKIMLSEAGSPYSPLFTSGLLSNDLRVPRRGSLPSDSLGGTYQSHSDTSSAFYFTLQARRDPIALRSFLSLDLAESIHTASLRKINTHPAPLLHTSKYVWPTSFATIPCTNKSQMAP